MSSWAESSHFFFSLIKCPVFDIKDEDCYPEKGKDLYFVLEYVMPT